MKSAFSIAGLLLLVGAAFALSAHSAETSAPTSLVPCPYQIVLHPITGEPVKNGFFLANPTAKNPEATAVPLPPPDAGRWREKVVAFGPILGAMDSPKMAVHVACTLNGVVLTATIVRSANFHGAALSNILWRPNVTAEIVSSQKNLPVTVIWSMRLSTGEALQHAKTPPYPALNFPIQTETRN